MGLDTGLGQLDVANQLNGTKHRAQNTDSYSANLLANTYQDISNQQFQNYNRYWYPVIARYIQTVNNLPSTTALVQGRAANSVRQQYSDASRRLAASDTNAGARPGSGRFAADISGLGLDEGSSLGRATQAAKEGVRNEQVEQLGNIARIGRGQAGAIGRTGATLDEQASEQAREDARAALSARQTFMNTAGTLGGAAYNMYTSPPPPPTGYAASMYGGSSGGETYNPPSGNQMFGIPTEGG